MSSPPGSLQHSPHVTITTWARHHGGLATMSAGANVGGRLTSRHHRKRHHQQHHSPMSPSPGLGVAFGLPRSQPINRTLHHHHAIITVDHRSRNNENFMPSLVWLSRRTNHAPFTLHHHHTRSLGPSRSPPTVCSIVDTSPSRSSVRKVTMNGTHLGTSLPNYPPVAHYTRHLP